MFIAEIERIGEGSVRPVGPASWEIALGVTSNGGSYHKRVAEKCSCDRGLSPFPPSPSPRHQGIGGNEYTL